MFGYTDSDGRLGVEKFMQRYYQVVMSIASSTMCCRYSTSPLPQNKTKVVKEINERFLIRDNYLDTTDSSVFVNHLSALLELFAILGENDRFRVFAPRPSAR